ncbi:hypothetical protein TeGR_g2848, partial [Tetraparma gracilis]
EWFAEFERDRFLVLKLEDMKADGMQRTMSKAFEFLELPDFEIEDEGAKNSRSYGVMSDEARDRLKAFYAPHDAKLFKLLGWTNGWERS